MPENAQITVQLLSFHMPARLCSKSFTLGFTSTSSENFQMYKLDLEKAEEPEIKLPTSIRTLKMQKNSRKTSTSASLTVLKPLCGSQQTMEYSEWDGNTRLHYCLLRNLHAGQEATVRTEPGSMDWFKIGKGVCQGHILSPCLFNLYAEYIMRNTRLDESQAEIKIARRNINNLRYADDTRTDVKIEL